MGYGGYGHCSYTKKRKRSLGQMMSSNPVISSTIKNHTIVSTCPLDVATATSSFMRYVNPSQAPPNQETSATLIGNPKPQPLEVTFALKTIEIRMYSFLNTVYMCFKILGLRR